MWILWKVRFLRKEMLQTLDLWKEIGRRVNQKYFKTFSTRSSGLELTAMQRARAQAHLSFRKIINKSWNYDFSERCQGGPKWFLGGSWKCLGAFRSVCDHFGCTYKPEQTTPWETTPVMKMKSQVGKENEGLGSFYFAGRFQTIVNDS